MSARPVALGWNDRFEAAWASLAVADRGAVPARVLVEHRELYRVHDGRRERLAEVSGRFRHEARSRGEFPAVGDWVVIDAGGETVDSVVAGDGAAGDGDRVMIHAVLPRLSKFSRQAAGEVAAEQVIAANVDTLFIVCGLDGDFNPRRIERYLTATWDCGARPVIVLNKSDVAEDLEALVANAEAASLGVPVHAVSAASGRGLESLAEHLMAGTTVAFVGSSGVGKSTLINRLLGREAQATNDVRASDSRGRHTTTGRQLFVLEGGALLLDTPGMRELQLWASVSDARPVFDDITTLAAQCRYRDCAHETENDCAIRAALESGELDPERLESFRKLERELAYQERRQSAALEAEHRQRNRAIHREHRKIQRHNRKR